MPAAVVTPGKTKRGRAAAADAEAAAATPPPKRGKVAKVRGGGAPAHLVKGAAVFARWGAKKYACKIDEALGGDRFDVLFDCDGTVGTVRAADITSAAP